MKKRATSLIDCGRRRPSRGLDKVGHPACERDRLARTLRAPDVVLALRMKSAEAKR